MFIARKRAEAEGRKGSFPCSKAMSSHHPTDPVELRRINFQTPGKHISRYAETHFWFLFSFVYFNDGIVSFSAYRVSVYRGYRRLSS